ncbi:MAG TPA: hypothetical protein VM056_04070 [Terriglobales bacterium]|nr:hypothetical protein [Terriglobales bacterium]
MPKKKPQHARKLSPESQAALKKYRESMANTYSTNDDHSDSNSTRRTVNQRTAKVFKKGGQ